MPYRCQNAGISEGSQVWHPSSLKCGVPPKPPAKPQVRSGGKVPTRRSLRLYFFLLTI